uniref:RAB3GAP2_N domain-containing protein n=1 Tax=Caenorhabditis japonica TaxID=281687 RepID=A0A8R1HJX7_CAEJA
MSVNPVNFEAFSKVTDDVAKQVKTYLLEKFERQNSDSSEDSEKQFCKTTEKKEHVEEWDDWGANEEKTLEVDESVHNWLFQCDLKTYADAEYLLVTWESRFVVLRKPPDELEYKIVCKQYIDGDPLSTEITASCLFGLSSFRHDDLLDSIIVALGTLNGSVYFYTETGVLLYFDRFSIFEPINNLLFEVTGQTFLVVLSKTFFMVNPISLKSVIYQAKVLIAKGEKTVHEISESIELQSELLAPYIKGNIIHVVFTGLHKPSTLEQYVAASYDSFYARVEKSTLPVYSTFMITTEKEFITFVWHDREEQDKLLDDVIKYGKSLVPSFGIRKFFGIQTEPSRVSSHMRSAKHVPTRSTILDERIAQTVARSPDCQYVAVTDRKARVIVIDVRARQMVLIYKGYRDASISWVSTTEGERVAQFLTIFAPRRSLLEVWTVLGNVRVCAQHVNSSECDIVFGGENKMLCGLCHRHTNHNSFFLDEKGNFNRISLPFHLALTCRARQDQHDHLLLKQIEKLDVSSDEFFVSFSKLKMATSRATTFQNSLHSLTTPEEAHRFISRIRSFESAASLGELVNDVTKSVGFYARILTESKRSVEDSETTSKFALDSIVERILVCHMAKYEGGNESEDFLTVGEWLQYVDLDSKEIDVFSENWKDENRMKLANLIFAPLYGSFAIDEFYDTVLEKLPVTRNNIVKLLLSKLERSRLDWRTFDRIVEVIVNLEKGDPGIVELVDKMAMNSKNVTLAIILLTICWCARKEIKRKSKVEEKDDCESGDEEREEDEEEEKEDLLNKTSDEWIAVSPEVEHIDSIVMCLHCVAIAQTLIESEELELPRVADLAQRIDSSIRENVAKWIVIDSIDVETIEKLFPRDPAENLFEEGDEEDRRRQMIIDFPEDKQIVVQRMHQMIPRVFEHDLVVAGGLDLITVNPMEMHLQ